MRKWIFRILIFVIIMNLLSFAFVDRELSKMFGGHTKVAEISLVENTDSSFAVVNATVLVPSASDFVPSQTVVVRDGIITSVGASRDFPSDLRIIDGTGMFLVPGYTDSHVHLWESENDLLLYLANGVTQIREMNGSEAHLQWKAEIAEGRLGPDMFVVGPQIANFGFLTGWFQAWTQNKINVRSAGQVERATKRLKNKGYDAIKASSFLDKSGYENLSQFAIENSLPLVGHIPMAIGLESLWSSSQSEVAHVEEIMSALNREFGGYDSQNTNEFLEFVQSRSGEVANRLRQNNISVTTTLWLMNSFKQQKSDLDGILQSVELEYANPGITEGTVITSRGMGWLEGVNIYRWPDDFPADRQQRSLTYWTAYAKAQHILLNAFLAQDVSLMVGTDTNVPVTVPGFSLHDEMITLNDNGMTPAQILAATTSVPGKWMKMNTGEVSVGFKANLVLLKENPLENIKATDTIEKVIVNGRVLSRTDLDQMLLAVKNANDQSRRIELDD